MELQKTFKRIYLLTFCVILLLMVPAFHPGIVLPKLDQTSAMNLQQLLILLGLVGFPGVLIWSSKKVKTLKRLDSEEERLKQYKTVVITRLVVFTAISLFALFMQLFTAMKGAFMFMMIILVLFMFIWPTFARFVSETSTEEKEVDVIADQDHESANFSEQDQNTFEESDKHLL